jgi:hypothetical protein
MEENWGKKEVDMILEELRQKGEYKMRAEIKKEIKDQDKELVKIHSQFFYVGLMVVTSLFGMIARRATTKFLVQHFDS